jgi:hypothetical protein
MQTPTNCMVAIETDQPYYVSVKTNINPALLRLVLCKQLKYYLSYTVQYLQYIEKRAKIKCAGVRIYKYNICWACAKVQL